MTSETTQPGVVPPPVPSPSPAATAQAFRDPTTITTILVVILWVTLALDVVAVVSGLFEYQLLQQIQSGDLSGPDLQDAAAADDLRQRIIGLSQFTLYIVTVIIFARWVYVLNSNKKPLGAVNLQFSPGWAVGWFFIPILNLWKPYQAMKELWQVSANPLHWQSQERGGLLPWWWFLWILSNGLGQISFRLSVGATDVSSIVASNIVDIFADASSVALEIVAIIMVSRIAKMQLANRPGAVAAAA
jgi:Domain of unknown function (DUF4328)